MSATLGLLPLSPTAGRILVYHHVSIGTDPALHVSPDLFVEHVGWLARISLRTVTVAEALDRNFPEGVVGLTFDDGYSSVAWACERLAARGWTATLFVVPAWLDQARAGCLSWSALSELARAGFEVGAHGNDHETLVGNEALSGLRRARERIEDRLQVPVRGLAYPYGVATRAARAEASAVYDYACTTEPHPNSSATARTSLGRNEIMATDTTASIFRAKLGGSDDWMTMVRAAEHRLRYGV